MFMDNVLELEKKVAELEERIKFLYRMLEKQSEINRKAINNMQNIQEKLFEYANATNQNTAILNMIGDMIKSKEED